jgi:fibronectin-binding autotransporter adhesin
MIGSDTGTAPAGSSGSSTGSGLDFVGTTVGPGQTGNFTAIAANTTNSPQSGSVSVNVYDHATTSGFSGGTLNLGDVHFGYANPASSSNSLNVANGAASDYRVPLMATGGTSGNLTVSGFTGVGPGASGSISATLASGQAVGSLNTSVIEQFADNSSLSGASSNLGTATINVVGQVYSGQSTWTNARGGAWASDNNWADNNVTSVDAAPGLDPNLTTTDTATFGAGSIAGSVQVDLVNAAPSLNALSFAGNGTYTIVSSGAGSIALAGSVPTITAIGTQTINATLTLAANTWITVTNPSDWLTIGGNIGETGGSQSLTLSGLGTLVLSGTNTYTGGTTVDRGTLRVSSPGSLASGATVSSGATLSGSGTINGSVTVASGGIVAPSGGGVANAPAGGATLTVGALSLAAGSQLNYQASGPGVLDSIVVTSTASPASVLTLPASGSAEFNFFQAGSATPYVFSGGVYSLMTFGSAANDPTPGNISALSLNPADLPSGDLATFSTTSTAAGGVLELTIVLSGPLYGSAGWASSISGVYDSASNWNPAKIPSAAGVIATFPAVAGATSPIDVTVGDSDVAGQLTFNSSSTSYLLKCGTLTLDNNGGSNGIGGSGAIVNVSGGAAPKIDSTLSLADSSQTTTFNIDGTTNSALTIFGSINDSSGTPGQSIVLTGGGMLYLEGANGYSGGTTVNSGTLYAGDQSPLATLGGGSAPLAINGSLSIVNLSNTRFSIGNLCGSGAGQLNMNSATLTVSQSSSTTFAGTLSLAGASSNLTVIGNGNTLTLSGPVSIGSGSALTVNSGTLQIGGMLNWGGANAVAVNGGTLALNPSSPATVSGAVSVTVAAGATLRLAGAEALSQGSTAANITTAGLGNSGDAALSVVGATSQTVGVISSTPLTTSPTTYAGNTMVGDGMNAASLSAAQILQNTLAINAGSTVTILPYAGDQEGGQNSSIAATSATPAVASTSTEPFDTSDPFSAIQAAIASGAITSATGQSLENRITAIAQLSAADPGLDASQLESRVLAILPSNTAADALALETVSGLLASDTGPLGSSPASKIGSESAAFAPTATSAVNSAAVNPAAVPEPSTILLAAFGSVGLIFALRRRRDRRE